MHPTTEKSPQKSMLAAIAALLVTTAAQGWIIQDTPGVDTVYQRCLGDSSVGVEVTGECGGLGTVGMEAMLVEEIRDTAETMHVDQGGNWLIVPASDWMAMDLDLDSLTFRGTVDVPDGGWYRLILRTFDADSATLDSTMSSRFRVGSLLENYQVIQRDIGGTSADVTIEGKTQAALIDHVQASVLMHEDDQVVVPWTTIDPSPENDAFSGTLTVPQGGWYKLAVRARAADNTALEQEVDPDRWGVGVNVLCIGQSNMSGGGYPHSFTPANGLAACFSNDNEWEHLQDPYEHGGGNSDIDKQWWGDGVSASPVPSLANALIESYGIPFAFVPNARGGTPLHHTGDQPEWILRDSVNHADTTNLYGNSIHNARQAGGVELLVMWQGETDADHFVPESTYLGDLRSLHANYREDLYPDIPLFIVQIGQSRHPEPIHEFITGIRSAQARADDGTSLFMAVSAVDIPLGPNDPWHPRNAGYDEIGRRIGNAVEYYYGDADYYRGPSVDSVFYDHGNRRQILVRIAHRAGTDLSPATGITGFDVRDGEKVIPIVAAVKVSSDLIQITPAVPISGEGTLRYFYGMNHPVDGLVRDNSALSLPLEPTIVPLPILAPPQIRLSSPSGGEEWTAGTLHSLLWTASGPVAEVKIEFSPDSGDRWVAVDTVAADDGAYTWRVADTSTASCLIRVSDPDNPGVSDQSTIAIQKPVRISGDIFLSDTTVMEGTPTGEVVGVLSVNVLDSTAFFLYTLVDSAGGEDNANFTIDGPILRTAEVFDFETKDIHSVLVRAVPIAGTPQAYQDNLTIRVTPQNEPPEIVSVDPMSDTVILTLDTTVFFTAVIHDEDDPVSSLQTSWTLDGQAVEMPLSITTEGYHRLSLAVMDDMSVVRRDWDLDVRRRVLTIGDTIKTVVPLSGIIRFDDSTGTSVTLGFDSTDFFLRNLSFAFIPDTLTYDTTTIMQFWMRGEFPDTPVVYVEVRHDSLKSNHVLAAKRVIYDYYVWDTACVLDTAEHTIWRVTRSMWGLFAIVNRREPVGTLPSRALHPRSLSLGVLPGRGVGNMRIRLGIPDELAGNDLYLDIFDSKGRVVRSIRKSGIDAGWVVVTPNSPGPGRTLGPNFYIARLRVGRSVLLRKFVLVR